MIDKNYRIKKNYQVRKKNSPFPDIQPTGTIYQPDVYEFAKYLLKRSGKKYLIDIGAGSGEKLKDIGVDVEIIALDCDTNIELLRKNLPNAKVIEHDFEKGLPVISEKILKDAVVISVDVIEHITQPHKYLKALSKISKISPFLLISTPDRVRARGAEDYGPPANPFHVREWTIDELYSLFVDYGIDNSIGFTVSNDDDNYKGTILALSGTDSCYKYAPEKKILAVMTAYNEEDIIKYSIQNLLEQGVDVHVIDNWSSDMTFDKVKSLAKKNKRITFERFPKKQPKVHKYEWEKLLKRVEEITNASDYDWFIHNDADELRMSAWSNVTLQQGISYVDSIGYNSIDFTVADFRPVNEGYDGSESPVGFFHDFEFTAIDGYLLQIKCWKKCDEGVDLSQSGGHHAQFEGQKVYPLKFMSKHYPIRSPKHGQKKIFAERKKDFDPAERKKGWHIQYDHITKDDTLCWNPAHLNKFTIGNFYNEYFVERLSGVGIIKKKDS